MSDLDLLLRKQATSTGRFAAAGYCPGHKNDHDWDAGAGMNPLEKNRNLIVYVEIDRCIADAIQAITGRSARPPHTEYRLYGKFAATYL